MFALLGPNGAGKTTTVEILEGYRERDGGRRCRCSATDPAAAGSDFRARIGIVLQSSAVYPPPLRPRDPRALRRLLRAAARRRRGDRARRARRRSAKRACGRSRADSCAASTSRSRSSAIPSSIFLDEPTTGFDPAARRQAWETIRDLRALGKSILLTTHYMEEAQTLADRLAILRDGRIVATGSPRELLSGATGGRDPLPPRRRGARHRDRRADASPPRADRRRRSPRASSSRASRCAAARSRTCTSS